MLKIQFSLSLMKLNSMGIAWARTSPGLQGMDTQCCGWPSEYRPSKHPSPAIWQPVQMPLTVARVAIGCDSGRVFVVSFSKPPPGIDKRLALPSPGRFRSSLLFLTSFRLKGRRSPWIYRLPRWCTCCWRFPHYYKVESSFVPLSLDHCELPHN